MATTKEESVGELIVMFDRILLFGRSLYQDNGQKTLKNVATL
jgi:hypothetical protein